MASKCYTISNEECYLNNKLTTKQQQQEDNIEIQTKKDSFIRMALSWENINVYSKKEFNCNFCSKNTKFDSITNINIENESSIDSLKKQNIHQILNNVNGIIYPGQSLAIMGASGSGKTTLLNALNFRTPKNFKVSGNIKLNGVIISAKELNSLVEFVPQDDLFISTLTVFEHLKFMAMLKMSNNYTKDQKLQRVLDVINEFNLTKCKDILIGSTDKKGISGGEKRRVAFASSILTEPQILFCDEPTSGLDSLMAQMIANTISKQAKKGKTIISIIHQPSSQVFETFDLLCLLSEGRTSYFGKRKLAFDFFSSLNYICPSMYNPADFYIEIIATKAQDESNKISIYEAYEKSDYKKNLLKKILNETENKIDKLDLVSQKKKKIKKYQASYFTQFIYIFWRQLKHTIREPFSARILAIQSIIIGLFLGFTYFQIKNDQTSVQNKTGLLFIILMQTCLSYLFGVANQYHSHWPTVNFEVKNNVYSIIVYYISKTLCELPQNILFPIITVSLVYWISNIHPSLTVFLLIVLIIVVSANISIGYGTFLSIVAPNIDTTVGLIGPTLLPLLIYSGYLINNDTMPSYFIFIKYISWIYYAFELLMIQLWTNVDSINCDKPDMQLLIGNLTTLSSQCMKNGQEVLDYFSINKDNFNRDIAILFSMSIFWPVLAGICLYIKTKLK